MSLSLAVDTMVSVGQNFSMDTRSLRDLVVKMFILSFKYVDRRALWDAVFPPAPGAPPVFVDWGLVRPQLNALGDLLLWLPLLDRCTWEGLERHEHLHPPLVAMRAALRTAGLDAGEARLPCQLLLLHMLHGIPSLTAFQMLTCRTLRRDTEKSSALLLARLSDSPHSPAVYEALFALLLGPCLSVDAASLEGHLRVSQARRAELSSAMLLKQMGSRPGRPRLSDRATPTDEQKVSLDAAQGPGSPSPASASSTSSQTSSPRPSSTASTSSPRRRGGTGAPGSPTSSATRGTCAPASGTTRSPAPSSASSTAA